MAKREVLFIAGKLDRGGGERVMTILANHFSAGFKVRIITLLSGEQKYELDESIEVIHLSEKDQFRFFKLPYWIVALMREFRKLKGRDVVVISFFARINIISIAANLFSKLPMIISERNDPRSDGRGIFTRISTRLLYPKAEAIVFQSEYAKNLFSKNIRNRGMVIYNPVGPFDLKKPRILKKAFVNAGRLEDQKNQTMLITAFSEVCKTHPEYKLYIYGEGKLRNKLEKLISDLGVSDNVELKGSVPDIHERMLECEVFVLSSDYEGQSNSLLEAMALGIPCITTRLPGHEGIVDKDNVYLVETGDVKQLKKAMLEMIENPGLKRELGTNAHDALLKFDTESILAVWDNLIKKVGNYE